MPFIEMTGKTLASIISVKELHSQSLDAAGVFDNTIVRINQQGDIEVRRSNTWDLVGGLLGNYEERIRRITGLDWA